jgi:hypothetical protein
MAKSNAQVNQESDSKEVYDKTYWLDYTEQKFEESKNWRGTNVELQWFVNYMYYMGYQNIKYDPVTGNIVKDSKDPLNFYINYTYMITRAVRNAVMRTQPQWDVDALPYGDLDPQESRLLGEYLGFEYDKLGMNAMTNKVVLYGLLYGLGIFQYGYDANADNGEGNVWVETLDPFDTYIDPYATTAKDARYIVKVMSKPLDLVEENSNYDQEALENIQSTDKMSESDYKDLIMNNLHDAGYVKGNVILHESWCMTKEGVRVITTCQNEILRNEVTDFTELPFVFYKPDINLSTVYGEGWVKNIVNINKALNYLETSRLQYNIIFNKGKMLVPKGAGIKNVTNVHGQKIEYKPGFKPEVMDMKPQGSDVEKQIAQLGQYMQQIGAANEAFLGQTPAGVKSGIAIETLVANNYVNLSDLISNLATALEDMGEAILKMGHQYQQLLKPFRTDSGEKMGVIGGDQQVQPESYDMPVVSIPMNPEVKVRITSGTAYTKEGKKEIMQNLRSMGAISNRTLLEAYDIDPEEEEGRMKEEMEAMQPQRDPQIDPEAELEPGTTLEI